MHAEAWKWVEHSFRKSNGDAGRVVEIGSYDHNGTARSLFTSIATEYVGVDVIKGKGVDFVGNLTDSIVLEKFKKKYGLFNTVISTETLEHTPPMPILRAMFSLLDTTLPVCRVVLTCANTKRVPHGHDGFEVKEGEYYGGVDEKDLYQMILFCLKETSIEWETHNIDIDVYWNNPLSNQDTYAYVEITRKPAEVILDMISEEQ